MSKITPSNFDVHETVLPSGRIQLGFFWNIPGWEGHCQGSTYLREEESLEDAVIRFCAEQRYVSERHGRTRARPVGVKERRIAEIAEEIRQEVAAVLQSPTLTPVSYEDFCKTFDLFFDIEPEAVRTLAINPRGWDEAYDAAQESS